MNLRARWVAAAVIGIGLCAGCAENRGRTPASESAALQKPVQQAGGRALDSSAKSTAGVGKPAEGAGGAKAGSAVDPAGPRIIRTGEMQLEVSKGGLTTAFDRVSSIATAKSGFVADSNLSAAAGTEGANRSGRLVLRVPGDRLDAVLAEIGPLGKVLSTQLKGEDVSGQLVDLGARIKTLSAEEDALRTLVGKANTVGEVLQVQRSLFDVRQQIEQLTAQQDGLTGAVAYATLTVGLREPIPGTAPDKPTDDPSVVVRSWQLAGDNTVAVLSAIALTLGATSPLWVPCLVAGLVAWMIVRRRRSADSDLQPPAEELAAG